MRDILKFLLDCPEWFQPKPYWKVAQVFRLIPLALSSALGALILFNALSDTTGRMDAVLLGLIFFEAGLLTLGVVHLGLWLFAWMVRRVPGHRTALASRA
ncbi:hypothetical protein [Pseudomonas sp. dw_358]|uniref:hypothetical protein n=1 Tax=Pseudomonas sp. dw_358 TaxID=2720083 RepID=UPI001BD312C3|nr:hypothetical protein [Pseudomonas sp. dw_358]